MRNLSIYQRYISIYHDRKSICESIKSISVILHARYGENRRAVGIKNDKMLKVRKMSCLKMAEVPPLMYPPKDNRGTIVTGEPSPLYIVIQGLKYG